MLAGFELREDPVNVSATNVYLEAVLVLAALSEAAIGNGNVLLGVGIASVLGDQPAGSAYVVVEENIYGYADEPNASEAISGVVSMSLFNTDSGGDVVVEGHEVPIAIIIEHAAIANWTNGSANGSLPGCWYWDEDAEGWSEEGCAVNFNDTSYALSSPTQTVCLCNHLTDFSVKTKRLSGSIGGVLDVDIQVNTISTEDIALLFTWDNLVSGAACAIFLFLV
jgi:hypothetical protein